jgi:hypothetical protein
MEDLENEIEILYDKYRAATNRAKKLIEGPGGIMELKQTIADKELEIEKLQSDIDLVMAYDSNLLDHLRGR